MPDPTERDIDADLRICAAATPGPWVAETTQQPHDCSVYEVVKDDQGNVLFDALNSDVALIHTEYEEYGAHRWDEVGRRNLAFCVAAREGWPAALRLLKDAQAELDNERSLSSVLAKHANEINALLLARDIKRSPMDSDVEAVQSLIDELGRLRQQLLPKPAESLYVEPLLVWVGRHPEINVEGDPPGGINHRAAMTALIQQTKHLRARLAEVDPVRAALAELMAALRNGPNDYQTVLAAMDKAEEVLR